MGNEAIALGAVRAGISVATGYPGTPSSEILETIAKRKPETVYAEWSVNEKSALEVAAGAAIAGLRSLVTMKQVGLNVASDPLMSLNYVGVKAGMVVVVADDPGPISSQTEQDTRHFGRYAKLVVFDPATPEEAYLMMKDAFELSEKIGRPVLFRPTTRVCHAYANVELAESVSTVAETAAPAFTKDDGRWVIFPRLTYANHIRIESMLNDMSRAFADYPMNSIKSAKNPSTKGIAVGGVSRQYLLEVNPDCSVLNIAAYPISEDLVLQFLSGLDEVLAVEELDPVIEDELLRICGKHRLNITVRGKRSGDLPVAGELSVPIIGKAVANFLNADYMQNNGIELPPLPIRPPVLCAGCPHRASFFAVKEASRGLSATYSGDIGCYTLGNAKPLDMVDTSLCMGAGITQAQGLAIAQPEYPHFAFIGDSTFFHTGIPGIINAVYNSHDVIICVLDNSTTAMTGGQSHPGMGRNLLGKPAKPVNIAALISAIGVDSIQSVNAFDLTETTDALKRALAKNGVRVIIFEGACVNIVKHPKVCHVKPERCTGCKQCVNKLGCPALSIKDRKAVIDGTLCTGCGLCGQVCGFGAIGASERQ
jgi:indolepyruvate ferredoxin oxidoreductase alpha subunit